MELEMIAILYKHGNADFEIWWQDLPQEAHDKIESILDEYRNRGCSLRGSLEDVIEDIKELEK